MVPTSNLNIWKLLNLESRLCYSSLPGKTTSVMTVSQRKFRVRGAPCVHWDIISHKLMVIMRKDRIRTSDEAQKTPKQGLVSVFFLTEVYGERQEPKHIARTGPDRIDGAFVHIIKNSESSLTWCLSFTTYRWRPFVFETIVHYISINSNTTNQLKSCAPSYCRWTVLLMTHHPFS